MNKKQYIILGIIVVSGLVLLAWKLPKKSAYMDTGSQTSQSQESPTQTTAVVSSGIQPTTSTQTVPPAKNGQYISYSPEIIANTSGTKVLFFHAPWCPQCRALEASIQAGPIPSNVSIIKVDYDTNQALRQKYGVTIQTTLVRVDDSGNLLKKYSAYNTPTLESLKANVL